MNYVDANAVACMKLYWHSLVPSHFSESKTDLCREWGNPPDTLFMGALKYLIS